MNERTTLEIIAPTVEEALAQGLAQLGLPADAVSVEVLDAGNKGLFGLGGRQVRVRLTVHGPEDTLPAEAPRREAAPAPGAGKAKPQPKREPKPEPKSEPKPEPKPELQSEPKGELKAEPASAAAASGDHDALLDTTEAIVSKLLHLLRMRGQVSAHYAEESSDDRRTILVDVRGEELLPLTSHRAEGLNAFQHVASLMVGKEAKQWVQLVVDVEGFRSRREKQLQQLARSVAEQVVKTGKRASLEPMSSSERRVVHIELRGHPAVTTESTGEEPHRKVVIIPKDS